VNAIQKPFSGLKKVLQKPHDYFKGFGSGFTEHHTEFDADTLLDFAIHRRREEIRSRKCIHVIMHVHSAVSRGKLEMGP
jgi:hypothetical protein